MNSTDRKQVLKTTLIAAAERAVAAHGLAGLKARSLAAEAGCAVGAIYNVVADLDDLALAVNARTLTALEKELAAAVRRGPGNATATVERAIRQLVQMAVAYLNFAAANKLRWRALFEHRLPEEKSMPEWYRAETTRLFSYIEEPLRDLLPAMPPQERARLARSMFSAVHGIATLGLEEKLGAISRKELRNQMTLIVSTIVAGLLAPGKTVS
jgi:AcrR family transcriptional regulator